MSPKKHSINAGLITGWGRALFGAVVFAVFWLGMGWLLSSYALGFVLSAVSLVIGPILFPPLLLLFLKRRGTLRRLDLARDPVLANEFFKGILRRSGPRPTLWVRPSSDLAVFWFENASLLGKAHQDLVVSTRWMNQPDSWKASSWRSIWDDIANHSPSERRLRTLQIRLWLGALAPLEILSFAMRLVVDILGFGDLPTPAFWMQRLAWDVKGLWFGLGHRDDSRKPETPQGQSHVPQVWNSLVFGVWFQLASHGIHPMWRLLTHRNVFLDADSL